MAYSKEAEERMVNSIFQVWREKLIELVNWYMWQYECSDYRAVTRIQADLWKLKIK